jgi:hypothetical protein
LRQRSGGGRNGRKYQVKDAALTTLATSFEGGFRANRGRIFSMSRNKTLSLEADEDLAYLLTHIGEDNMIMGSDYGHQDQFKEERR